MAATARGFSLIPQPTPEETVLRIQTALLEDMCAFTKTSVRWPTPSVMTSVSNGTTETQSCAITVCRMLVNGNQVRTLKITHTKDCPSIENFCKASVPALTKRRRKVLPEVNLKAD